MSDDPTFRGHPVPREPSEYRPTTHFLQRRHERDPTITGGVIRHVFANGDIYESPHRDVDNAYIFREFIDGFEWRLVVGLMPAAFERDGAKHKLLTGICELHQDWDEETYRLPDPATP